MMDCSLPILIARPQNSENRSSRFSDDVSRWLPRKLAMELGTLYQRLDHTLATLDSSQTFLLHVLILNCTVFGLALGTARFPRFNTALSRHFLHHSLSGRT